MLSVQKALKILELNNINDMFVLAWNEALITHFLALFDGKTKHILDII